MKKLFIFCAISLLCGAVNAQNASCAAAAPFCTSIEYNFPATTGAPDAEAGPNYGCLGSEPNPAWYFMQVQNSGDILIHMIGSSDGVTPTNDIDFICYGPFSSIDNVCGNLTANNTVDCSYSGSATEDVDITNAISGEYYMLLITNFSDTPCNIIFSQNQTAGSGTTNCSIVNPVCEGDSVSLDSHFDPNGYLFTWTGPNGFSSTDAVPVFPSVTLDLSGEYNVVATDFIDTVYFTIELDVQPRPDSSGFTVEGVTCVGNTILLHSDSTYDNASYNWTLPNGTVLHNNPATISNVDATLAEGITLTITLGGCTSLPVTQPLVISAPIVPVISGDPHYCFDDRPVLETQGGFDFYNWSQPSTADTLIASAGVITVATVDSNGCTANSAPFTLTSSSPDVQVSGIQPFCQNDSILLTANEGVAPFFFDYYWQNTDGDTLSETNSYFQHGEDITLLVVDAAGCRDSMPVIAPATGLPTASFIADPGTPTVLVNTPFTFTDHSTAAEGDPLLGWEWALFPPSDTVFFNTQNTAYTWLKPDTGVKYVRLIVTSSIGCKDTAVYTVYIVDKPFVPNVINPESEVLLNKSLKIPFLDQWPGNNVAIFNRWGKKVFEASNYGNDWNGDNLPAGTYFYVVSAPNLEPLKGSITLMRN